MSISSLDSGSGGLEDVPRGPSSGCLPAAPYPQECGRLPWVDLATLNDLEKQIGNPDIARRFARDYARMWVQRQRTLAAAVERQDHDVALDAALSLKNSSAMVGGIRLARLVKTLEKAIRTGEDLDSLQLLVEKVAQQGTATVCELQQSYISKGRC